MKFRITLRDPDGISDAIYAVRRSQDIREDVDLEEARLFIRKWVKHSEYLTVEIDTEASTCIVLPV